jgi:hypothetical protein
MGVEYDRVILVEPADTVAVEPPGMNRLYVALIRSAVELVILHSKPVPDQPHKPAAAGSGRSTRLKTVYGPWPVRSSLMMTAAIASR